MIQLMGVWRCRIQMKTNCVPANKPSSLTWLNAESCDFGLLAAVCWPIPFLTHRCPKWSITSSCTYIMRWLGHMTRIFISSFFWKGFASVAPLFLFFVNIKWCSMCHCHVICHFNLCYICRYICFDQFFKKNNNPYLSMSSKYY